MNKRVFDILRELDSVVDFSRAKLQWDILIILATKGPSSTTEISQTINTSRKSIIDAIRKLIDKELVARVKHDIYELTDKGKELLNKVDSILGLEIKNNNTHDGQNMNDNSLVSENFSQYFYLITLFKMIITNHDGLNLDKVAQELGVSRQTLKYYLELFEEKKLLKVISKKNYFKKTIYKCMLMSEGRRILFKLPEFMKMKTNLPLKIILRLTNSYTLEAANLKVMGFIVISVPLLMYFRNELDLFELPWLCIVIFLALLSIFSQILNR
ncbi:MarR family transcriptional regulator [Sulfolobus acidocaldarius SUSAZ]|nr:MarR family transcriptional regulator [Sulfolobus acidocaldarius SUSAZ]